MKKVKLISKYVIDTIDYEHEKNKIDEIIKEKISLSGFTIDKIIEASKKSEQTKKEKEAIVIFSEAKKMYEESYLRLKTYKDYTEDKYPELCDTDTAIPYYVDNGNTVAIKWEIKKNNVNCIKSKIEKLKNSLSESDYKITKCYEAFLTKRLSPYDIAALSAEREEKRKEINELEKLLKN